MDMIENLNRLKSLQSYQNLNLQEQMIVARNILNKEFSKTQSYQALNPREKKVLLGKYLAFAPTFQNQEVGQYAQSLASKYYGERVQEMADPDYDADKKFEREIKRWVTGDASVRNTGILPLLTRLTDPIAKALGRDEFTTEYLLSEDNKKAASFLRNYMNIMEESAEGASNFGKILGFVGDIASFQMTFPAVPGGTISKVGKSGKTVAKMFRQTGPQILGEALSKNVTSPFMIKSFRYLTPIATEATIEGFLGTLRDNYIQKRETGEGLFAKGAEEVMKHWGIWALEDFAVGTLGTTLLATGGSYLKARKYNKAVKDFRKVEKSASEVIDELSSTVNTPETLKTLPINVQDKIEQIQGLKRLFDNGLEKADELPIERMYYAAQDTGIVSARQADGTFRMHYVNDSGSQVTRTFDNLSETNDFLVERAQSIMKKMPDGKRDVFLTAHPEIRARVETLDTIDGYFNLKKHSDLPEELKANLSKKKGPLPQERIYLTKQEADFLGTGNAEVQKARVELGEEALEKAKLKKHPLEKQGGARFVPDDVDPNAIVITKKTASPEDFQVAQAKAQKALQNEGSLDEGMLIREYLVDGGFDSAILPDGTPISLYPSKTKIITDLELSKIKELNDAEIIFSKGSRVSKRTQIETQLKGKLNTDVIDDPELFSKSLEYVTDSPTQTNVGNITRMYARNFDKKYTVNVSKLPKNSAKKVSMTLDETSKTINVRYDDLLNSPTRKRKFIEDYVSELDRVTKGKSLRKKVPFNPNLVLSKTSYTFGNPQSTLDWLKGLVKTRNMGSLQELGGDAYRLITPSGTSLRLDGLENVKNFIVRNSYNFQDAQYDLAREGISLSKKSLKGQTTFTATLSNGKKIENETLGGVLRQVDFTPTRLDVNRYGPKVVGIDNSAVDVSFKDGTLLGPRRSVLRSLQNFEDKNYIRKLEEVFQNNKGKIEVSPDKSYKVYLPSMGTSFDFKDLKSARKFLQSDVNDYATVYSAGKKKGLILSPQKQGFLLADGKNTYTVKSLEEAQDVIKSYGDPTVSAPSILTEEIDAQLNEVLLNYNKAELPEVDTYAFNRFPDTAAPNGEIDYSSGIFDQVREKIATTERWLEKYSEATGDANIIRYFREVERARKAAQVNINDAAINIKKTFMPSGKNRTLNKKSRQKIFYHLGAQTPEEVAFARSLGELDGAEQEVANRVKEVYESLGRKFGIKTQDLIHNYMPRLMKWSKENAALVNQMTNAEELFEAFSSSTGITANINFFAKNQRVSEILYFAHQNDALEVLLQYSSKGHKNFFIEPAWNNFQNYMVKNRANVPGHVMNRLNYYKEMLTSSYKTDGMEFVEKMGEKFMQRLSEKMGSKKALAQTFGGISNAEAYGRDLFKTMFSLNYVSSMGARPWLAIRNSFQPWTTLAPRFGNGYVMQSIKDVQDLGEDYFTYLHKIGVVGDKPPLVNEILDDTTFLGKLTEKSLSWYKSSDDYTRAIAARTADLMMDDGVDRLSRGLIKNKDQFKKVTQLNKINTDIADTITDLVYKGDDTSIASAKAMYMNKVSEDTMFGYRKTEAPQMFTSSIVGKLFGQYGTYSAGYRANMMRGLTYGSFKDKAGFAARFLGNQAALFGAFTALGISAKNFIPGGPAIFTGGPFFDLSLSALKSMDFTTYEGAQAREELKRNLTYMIPGALHVNYLSKALKYLEEDDPWKAWLSLTSTPTIND